MNVKCAEGKDACTGKWWRHPEENKLMVSLYGETGAVSKSRLEEFMSLLARCTDKTLAYVGHSQFWLSFFETYLWPTLPGPPLAYLSEPFEDVDMKLLEHL